MQLHGWSANIATFKQYVKQREDDLRLMRSWSPPSQACVTVCADGVLAHVATFEQHIKQIEGSHGTGAPSTT